LILGTALTITPSYIFLAIVLAPALVKQGLNPMATHLFILYWAMLSDITPPTALSVVVASSLAGAPVMRAMVEAMRFGAVKYFLPFFFVYSPALVAQGGTPLSVAQAFATAMVCIGLLAYALQGYLPWVGALQNNPLGYAVRVILVASGFLLAFPEPVTTLIGLSVGAAVYILTALVSRAGWLKVAHPVRQATSLTDEGPFRLG